VRRNLLRHLQGGTTTVLNVDGFALPEEVEAARRLAPVNLHTATCHTPLSLRAALLADGGGLSPRQRHQTAERMVEPGVVCLGEIGSGHTLGGGGQEYLYIPRACASARGGRSRPRGRARSRRRSWDATLTPGRTGRRPCARSWANWAWPTSSRPRMVGGRPVVPGTGGGPLPVLPVP